jgi:hypothetical protein
VGLAIATKSWALVTLAPVIFTLPARRWRAVLTATSVASIFLAPFLIAQHTDGTAGAGVTINGTGIIFQPQQIWWFLGSDHTIVHNSHGVVMAGYRAAPGFVSRVAHPLIILISVPLTLFWSLTRRGRPGEPFALLALLLLLRCLLDPWNNYYYAVPFIFALATWEISLRRDPPLLALAAVALQWACFRKLPLDFSPDIQAAAYLVWVLPTATMIATWLYAPGLLKRVAARLSDLRLAAVGKYLPLGGYSPPSR